MYHPVDPTAGLIIIADDLTGALDASAPFATATTAVSVATSSNALPAALDRGTPVVAVSTRSRDITPDQAAARIHQVLANLDTDRRLFKKIDSRLKGQLAAELAALPPGPLLVLPAIPVFGRVVRNGGICGFGVTEPIPIRPRLGLRGAGAIIPDTESDADIAEALASAPSDAVLIGARGLGVVLAQSWGGISAVPAPLSGRIAVAVGSTDPITLAQLAPLAAQGIPISPAPDGFYDGTVPAGDIVILQATPGTGGMTEAEVAATFARSFIPFSRDRDCLLLTGGATAEAVLDALGVGVLTIEGELLPGLPLSRAGPWRIVTKSGGFGEPDTLNRLFEHLQAMR